MAHDEKLIEAIQTIIEHPAGFGIELFLVIGICRVEDGRYAVGGEGVEEHLFPTSREAAIAFLDLREACKCGYDFETKPN